MTEQSAGTTGQPTPLDPAAPPSLARRFGALMVDWILCVLVSSLLSNPFRDGWAPLLVLIVEYGFFIGLFTNTPGMWLCRIRVVSTSTGGRIGLVRAALRGALLTIVIPALVMDANRRGWHDRAVGSVLEHNSERSRSPGQRGPISAV